MKMQKMFRAMVIFALSTVLIVNSSKAQPINYDMLINQAIVNNDSATAVKHLIKKIKKTNARLEGLSSLVMNNQIFDILFKYSTNKKELLIAAKLMSEYMIDSTDNAKISDGLYSNLIDTYANLLYKGGKTKEAIEWQQKGLDAAPEGQKTNYITNLEKMKAGIPTW